MWQVSARGPQLDAVQAEAGRALRDVVQVRAWPQVVARPEPAAVRVPLWGRAWEAEPALPWAGWVRQAPAIVPVSAQPGETFALVVPLPQARAPRQPLPRTSVPVRSRLARPSQ
jgi:hypothetical protein